MFKRIFSVAVIFLFVTAGHSQNTWIKTYGGERGDEGWDVQQTVDGGYIIAGRTYSFGADAGDVYLIKLDASGQMKWEKNYGGNDGDGSFSVQQTSDFGYVAVGNFRYAASLIHSIYLLKTNFNGDTLWTKTYILNTLAIGRSIQQTIDGGYVIAGYSNSGGVLLKTNSIGDTHWTRIFRKEVVGDCNSVQQTFDGSYIITGEMNGLAVLVKTDSNGHIVWSTTFGAKRLDRGYSVRQTDDGGYIITGIQYIPGAGESSSRVFLIKTDAIGDTLWTRKLGDTHSAGRCVRQTNDGGYIVTGYEDMGYISLYKTDNQGYLVWKKIYFLGKGLAVRQTTDGGYIITGTGKFQENKVDSDVFLIKTNDIGDITSIHGRNFSNIKFAHEMKLYQSHPNPFNQSTTINYEVFGYAQDVKLAIYDLTGKEVKTLIEQRQSPGKHQITWDGRDKRGTEVPSGMYIYTLRVGDKVFTKKLTLMK